MKAFGLSGLFLALLLCPISAQVPEFPKPVKENEWLQKMFVGTWEGEGECMMEPGKSVKCKGTEVCKAVGGFWVHSEMKGNFAGMDMNGFMTLGFDAGRKKFNGTWIDSMSGHLYTYSGSIDSTGKILTLESEGPDPSRPGKLVKMKDVTEFKSDTEKVMTSSMEGPDGKWMTCMTMTSKKK